MRGDKSSYTGKQKRQAEHIKKGYEKRGVKPKAAVKRAWATVNKVSGGGKKVVQAGAKANEHTMPHLTAKEVNTHLKAVPSWRKRAQVIQRTYQFVGFLEALEFVKRVAWIAQKNNHHPDIDIRFNEVTLAYTTHDEGGLTSKDFSLARQGDEIFAKSVRGARG